MFSVINYSTSRRTREIGIRLALGAQRRDILKLIMNEGLFIVGVGVVIGLAAALAGGSERRTQTRVNRLHKVAQRRVGLL